MLSGSRVKATFNIGGIVTNTTYIGDYLEWTGSTSTRVRYYVVYAEGNRSANGTRIAMRVGSTRYFLFSDHLGSTSITTNSGGTSIGELRYKAWGETRFSSGTTYTNRRFTGQIRETSLGGVEGLYFYNSRWYDSALGRFAQADSIIPEPGDPQVWDRYAYVFNSPVRYTDPSGHNICDEEGNCWDQGQRGPGLRFGKPPDDELPPVVHYIYVEMIKNAKSNVTLFILALNSQSQFLTGGVAKAEAYTLWGVMVRTNGPWDHKSYIRNMESEAGRNPLYQRVGEFEYKFDTWSNIHYGYAGAAAGFSSEELLNGAGLEQIGTNIIDRRAMVAVPGISGLKRYDDPYDQAGIELGYQLWLEHGLDLKLEDLIQALAYAPGLNRRPFGGESQ